MLMAGEGNATAPNAAPNYEIPQEDHLEHDAAVVEQTENHQEAVVKTEGRPQETVKQPPAILPQDEDQTQVVATDDDQQTQAAQSQTVTDDLGITTLPAKDSDLIEKEWVERAKSVISKTADDPHDQKTKVSQMKAAYIQKRFNKTVKTDEAAA